MTFSKRIRVIAAAALMGMVVCGAAPPVYAASVSGAGQAASSAAQAGQGQYIVITGSTVNLRAGAGTSYDKTGKVKKGQKYLCLSEKKGDDGNLWYQIKISSSKNGWVSGQYAKRSGEPGVAVDFNAKRYIVITGGSVNLRGGAGTSHEKVGTAKKGSQYVWVTSKKTNNQLWHQIQVTSSKKAWVMSNYARFVNNNTSFTPYLTRTITVKKGSKTVYAAPDSKSTKLGKVSGGAKYKVLEWHDNGGNTWFAFTWKGKTAWIHRGDVTVSDSFKKSSERDFSDGTVPIIYLSPSKQPNNDYAYGKTNEQEQMYRVAAKLQKILEDEYTCYVYTAPKDLYLSLDGRALDAYNKHADIYLAIHSNSDGVKSKKSYGAVGYYQPKNAKSQKLAENFTREMGKVAFKKSTVKKKTVNGMNAFDGLGYSDVRDLAYYGIPSILAEVEYHDNADSAKWIIKNPGKIARALANALASTFKLQPKAVG